MFLRTTLALSSLVLVPGGAFAQKKVLTLEQTMARRGSPGPVDFSGSPPEWSWAHDGVHLVKGEGEKAVWVDPATMEEVPKQPEPEDAEAKAKRDARAKAFTTLSGVDSGLAGQLASARGDESEDGAAFLTRRDGTLWFARSGAGARRMVEEGHEIELEDLSPDGRYAAYVAGNDLVVVETETGKRTQVTEDGSEDRFNGKLDWVYQEEVYGRGDFKAFWWSPDSWHIAFLALDEADVHEFTVVDHIEDGHFRVKPEITKYPKAGDPNPTVRLGVLHVTTGEVTWVDLSRYGGEFLIVRVGWTPDGTGLVFMVQNRIQSWLDLDVADPESGEVTTWIHERSNSWVERPVPPRWLEDGSYLWESHRTGYNHLYHYRAGELVRPVTSGEWAVRSVERLDEETGTVSFTANKDGAVNVNVYRVGLDGGGFKRLTQGEGRHSLAWNDTRTLFLDRFSSLESPAQVRLSDADGRIVHELGQAEIPAEKEYHVARWERAEIPARDGFLLDAAVLKPVPFDPDASYPVWIPTYSGPDAPSVRNAWNGSAWYQFLAQHGVVVMQVNVRSASGKGHAVIEKAYKQLGVQELRDLEDAVDWICANPWADAGRVGITGYSYGGFMSAYALCASEKFALGLAGGGVYDWGLYDTIYTERYMSTPQRNPEGYAVTSCLKRAKDLSGHLYMHHGVMDDNVHVQNIMQLAYALQKAGKDFEMMVYPQQRHGIRDSALRAHARRKEWSLIRDYLIEPAPRGAALIEASSTSGPSDG